MSVLEKFDLGQLQQGVAAELSEKLGVIRVSGEDARTFLHAQLTQDVSGLSAAQTKLAGYCSAKGRLYAVFQMFSVGDDVYLVTQRELIEFIVKRLKMFVLRAKVVIEDVSDVWRVVGLSGEWCLPVGVAEQKADVYRLGVLPSVINGQTFKRELLVLSADSELCEDFADLNKISTAGWQWLSIMASEPHVEQATLEAFVPQMINLDRVDGVNFKKGCYPGQEIVARSHYLGKLKRRMQAIRFTFKDAATAQGALAQMSANSDVYSSNDDTQPAGVIVTAAVNPIFEQSIDALVEVSLPMIEGNASLSIPNVEPIQVEWLELPYSLA